jgi:non-ribosomal peptide synthetase component F
VARPSRLPATVQAWLNDFLGEEQPPRIFDLGVDVVCKRSHLHTKIAADAVNPSNLAFILMTSGSTGQPKGIEIQHQAIATHCIHVAPVLGCQPSTKFLQFSSYAYDAAFAETFDTLIHGGTLCLPPEYDRMNNLAGAVEKMQASMIALTPAFLATLSPQDFPTLKTIVVAGDRVPQHVNDVWAPKLRLIEAYGPAESCVATSIRNASETSKCGNLRTPSWCALWVTDPHDPEILVPLGVTGELLIQGPVLAKGYAGDDEKTRAPFIQSPCWLKGVNSN